MPYEIERKFLVCSDGWKRPAARTLYRQGYLSTVPDRVVRVRTVGEHGYLTIKGSNAGARRCEFEYPIPRHDAAFMLEVLCEKPIIEKYRTTIAIDALIWEVDEFAGDNEGLVVAEVEILSECMPIDLPSWIGAEVTGDPRYYNSNLVRHPFILW